MLNQAEQPRPPTVNGIKIFDNDEQAMKYYCCLLTVKLWGQAKVIFCSLVIIIKNFKQQETLAAHFDFTSFSAWRFLDSWPQLFLYQGCLGWDNNNNKMMIIIIT